MQKNRFGLPTLLADAVGGGNLAPGYTLPQKTPGMSATQSAGYSTYNPGVTPVSTSATRGAVANSVITGAGVTPIDSTTFNSLQQNINNLPTFGQRVSNVASNVASGVKLASDVMSNVKVGGSGGTTLAGGGVIYNGSTPEVNTSGNEFIRGTYGINEVAFDPDSYTAPSVQFPSFSGVSDAEVDAAFGNYLESIGYKRNADGQFTLDTSLYEEQGELLTKTFDQLKSEFKQQYDRLREDLSTQQQQVQRGFRESRQQVAEQAYLGERQLQQALAGRGLGGSGLAQLGRVQQQIARGQQITNLASEYSEAQKAILTAQTRGSDDLTNKLAQADLQLQQGQIDIAQRQRIEEDAFRQFLGSTRMALQDAINDNNYRAYSAAVNEYNAAVQANQDEFNKKVTLANMELSNLYDDYMAQFELLAQEYEMAFANAKDKQKPEVQAEYNATVSTLRRQYETNRGRIQENYGLTG